MPKNDLKSLRLQFPIFQQKVNGYPFIYFDSASTAQMPQTVVDSIVSYYTTYKANVGRGVYTFAEKATAAYEASRDKVARFIGASRKEIVFTSGATASLNMIVGAWAEHALQAGDEILVSAVEHHSNFVPWQQLALRKGLKIIIMPVNAQGVVDVTTFKKHVSPKTKLVAIVHTSNVLGSTNDVEAITQLAHGVGAKVVIDACQSVAHQVIDVQKIGCDFLVFSGHKLFGPTGVGVLFVKELMIPEMKINSFGGGMVFSVEEKTASFKPFPHSFEAGTPNIAQVIGLGAAVDFVQNNIDFEKLAEHETMLTQMLLDGLKELEDIVIVSSVPFHFGFSSSTLPFVPSVLREQNSLPGVALCEAWVSRDARNFAGPAEESSINNSLHLVTFYSKTHHGHDIAAYLDQFGIAVRAGHHCVQLFHQACGINASVRVSFSLYNTKEEVAFFLNCLKKLLLS